MQAKELVQEEFYQQKRTSRLQVTALMRLLQLLSRDVRADHPADPMLVAEPETSIDRHQETQEVSSIDRSLLVSRSLTL